MSFSLLRKTLSSFTDCTLTLSVSHADHPRVRLTVKSYQKTTDDAAPSWLFSGEIDFDNDDHQALVMTFPDHWSRDYLIDNMESDFNKILAMQQAASKSTEINFPDLEILAEFHRTIAEWMAYDHIRSHQVNETKFRLALKEGKIEAIRYLRETFREIFPGSPGLRSTKDYVEHCGEAYDRFLPHNMGISENIRHYFAGRFSSLPTTIENFYPFTFSRNI